VSSSPDPLADSAALASTRAILHRPPPRAPLARIRKRLLLREVNERIRDVSTDFCTQHECEFLCECGDPDCREPVSLSLAEYGEVRANPSDFLTAPEHWGGAGADVVARYDRFTVVRLRRVRSAT